MVKYFRYFPKVSGGRNQWVDLSPASTLLNNEFFEIGTSVDVSPETGELSFSGFSPTIGITDNVNVITSTGELILTGFEPTVQTPVNSNTLTGELQFNAFSPIITISDNINVLSQTGAVILVGYSPTVKIGVNIEPETAQIIYSGFAPQIIVPARGVSPKFTNTGGFNPNPHKVRKRVQEEDEEILAIIQTFVKCQK